MEANRITDFFVWDLRRIFTAHEVAYLWFGLQPNYGNDHPGNITSFVLALSETQLRSELLLTGDTGRRYYTDSHGKRMEAWVQESPDYERASLRSWAERIGQKPLFLFPEYREPLPLDNAAIVSCGNEDIPPRAKSTLLKMLDAALSQQYGQDWLDGDVETRIQMDERFRA